MSSYCLSEGYCEQPRVTNGLGTYPSMRCTMLAMSIEGYKTLLKVSEDAGTLDLKPRSKKDKLQHVRAREAVPNPEQPHPYSPLWASGD